MWWVGQLNNYVPCSFVLDDDTTFLRKYAATDARFLYLV